MRASDFWEIGGFDEECNPADTNYESGMFDESICREDLKLGLDTQDRFGANSVVRVYDALVPTSARRSENSGLFTVDSDENWATPVRRYRER